MRILGFNDLSDKDRAYMDAILARPLSPAFPPLVTGGLVSVNSPAGERGKKSPAFCPSCGAKTIRAIGVAICSSCDWTNR